MSILDRIVARKRAHLPRLRAEADALTRAAAGAPPPRSLAAALQRPEEVAVIAEHKRRSPSAGWIREGSDAEAVARAYGVAGAAALSVLTDANFFGGSPEDLGRARAAVDIPVLRKDFLVDPVQVTESRAMGADAILLIARILDDAALTALLAAAAEAGMDALVEVHDGEELARALAAGARILGINSRDLATFRTDLAVAEELAAAVPPHVLLVGESGIRTAEDVDRLGRAGVEAVLVGETLMRAPEPGPALARLVGRPRRARATEVAS